MASGTITGSTGNEYIDAKVVWSSSTTPESNYSTVSAILYYKRNNTGFTTKGTGTFSITINGTTTTKTNTITITESGWVQAIVASTTVKHNSDGSKSITISASGSIPDTTLTSTNVSGTVKLDTIARLSSLTSLACATKYFTGELTYKYKTQNASFYNRCNIAVYDGDGFVAVKSINLGQQSTAEKTATVTLSESELSIIYNAFPDTDYGRIRFTLRTYTNSDYSGEVGSGSYKDINLYIPNTTATQPTATMTLTPVSSLASPFNTLYIRGRSKADVNFTNAEGKYGASIVSYKVSIGGISYASPYTSGYLTTAGSVTVTGTLTDSRGFSRTYTQTITVLSYDAPTIIPASGESAIICARCDADGNLSDSGTYLKIKAKRNYSPVISSGVQKNFCSIRYRYKAVGGSYSSWATILATTASSDEVETGALLGSLDTKTSYLVQVQSIDTIGATATANISIPTERIYWHRAGSINSFGFGGYVEEENLFSIAGDIGFAAKGGFVPIEIPEYTDFDTLTKPNLYYARYTYVPGYVNCPISEQTTFSLEVIALGKDGQLLQRVTRCSAEATIYERQYYSSEWHEWECVNPPMVVGEEYRTKERYMGKPVYTKLIFCDTLPNAAYKLFEHGATATQAIRCVGQMSDGNSIPFHFSATNWVEIYAGPEYVVILTGNDKTNRSAYAQLWYVKE